MLSKSVKALRNFHEFHVIGIALIKSNINRLNLNKQKIKNEEGYKNHGR